MTGSWVSRLMEGSAFPAVAFPAAAFPAVAFVILCAAMPPQAYADGKHPSRFEQDLKRSTETIDAQKIEHAKMSLQQAEKRALEISSEAERKCNAIKEEENAMIGDGRGPVFPFRAFRTASSSEIEEAKKPYEDQIQSVHTDTQRRIKEILDEGQQAVDAIEQSAAHVHKGVHEYAPNTVRKFKSY
ncbi:MAG: hypothetical protein EKK48_20055 [Candidatus Melainabacteria bacterium]|nr:MAG: hypothetical protein EKK48_20055 [Candidatus Melainabacteria bacterium]